MQTPDATGAAAPTIVETLTKLGADDKRGLTDVEVQARLTKYGPNALVEKQKNTFAALLQYFWGPIPWMIEAAALMAFIVGDWGDFTIITSLLLFNALLGFWEEHEASNALDALKSSLALKARVLRDGKWQQVDAHTLVPGDIIEGKVNWKYGTVMAVGALLGGYLGGSVVRFVNRTVVRLGIVTLGIAIAAYYFWRIYGVRIHLLSGD